VDGERHDIRNVHRLADERGLVIVEPRRRGEGGDEAPEPVGCSLHALEQIAPLVGTERVTVLRHREARALDHGKWREQLVREDLE
jgi:hypothetical protein